MNAPITVYGSGVDRQTWGALQDLDMSHQLWCSVIRSIAREVVARSTGRVLDSEGRSDEDEVFDLVSDWQDSTIPAGAELACILGELDYFRDIGLSWDEKISFAGTACGYAADVAWDIRNRLEHAPNAKDAITEDLIESFYEEWRTRFLHRALHEAKALNTGDP